MGARGDGVAARGELRRIDGCVDRVADPGDPRPADPVVAQRQPQLRLQGVLDLRADVADGGELAFGILADVRGLGENAASSDSPSDNTAVRIRSFSGTPFVFPCLAR